MNRYKTSPRRDNNARATRTLRMGLPAALAALLASGNLHASAIAELAPASYDFGGIDIGNSSVDHAFTLTNSGDATLSIIGAAGPAEFPISSNNCPSVLAVGSSCVFNVAFAPSAAGARTGTLTVYTGSGNQVANLSGTGGGPLAIADFSPADFDFGALQIGGSSPAKVFTLSNSGSGPLTVGAAAISSNFVIQSNSCPGVSTSVAPGGSCMYSVVFNPLVAGPLAGTLTISTNLGDQVADLHGIGVDGLAPGQLNPLGFNFGDVVLGSTSADHAFTLSNNGSTALGITGAALPAAFPSTNNCPGSLPAGASCVFTVHFQPASLGASSGTLKVYTDSGTYAASLSGNGASVALSDAAPDPIAFTPATGVAPNTLITSDSITVAGVNTAIAVSVSGGMYALNGGAYTATAGTVHAGDTVTVRVSSSPNFATATVATLTLGSGADAQSADFSVTTLAVDSTPDAFAFGSRGGVARNSVQTSGTITPSGFGSSASISVSGGSYSINGGAFTSGSGSIDPGDNVAVQLTASDQFSTATSVQLTIGGVSGSFTVTTAAADLRPDIFVFGAINDVMPGSLQTSNTVTISGINSAVPIGISGGLYSINGGAFTSDAGTINAGDSVTVRQTASSNFSTKTTATLTVGSGVDAVSGGFVVKTVAAMPDPTAFTFGAVDGVAPASVQTSGAITVSGTNTTSAISISGGSYAVNGGAFTTGAGSVQPGDQVAVRTVASAAFSSTTVVTLQIGATQGTYSVTTLAADTAPDPFAFDSVSGVAPSSLQTSNTIVVGGINTASPVSISGGQYRINDGAYTSDAGSVNSGDSISVQKSASADFASTTQATLSIGGVSASFAITTTAADTVPDAFTIPTIADAQPGTSVTSETVLIGGINAPTPFSVSSACLQVGSNPACIGNGTLNPGDSFAVVVTSSNDYCTSLSGSVTIGGVTAPFTVTTTCTLPQVRVKAGGGSFGGGLLLVLGAFALLRTLLKRGRFTAHRAAALAGLLLVSATPAQALDANPIYGGLRLGAINSNLGSTLQSGLRHRGYGQIRSDGGDSRFGGTLYVGYIAAPGVGFELGYTHTDDPHVRLNGQLSPGTDLDALLRDAGQLASAYGDLYSFAVRLPLSVGPALSIAPRAGVLLVDSDAQLRAGTHRLDNHDRSGGYVLGSDLRYRVWRGLHVGASIDYFDTSHGGHTFEYAALLEWHP